MYSYSCSCSYSYFYQLYAACHWRAPERHAAILHAVPGAAFPSITRGAMRGASIMLPVFVLVPSRSCVGPDSVLVLVLVLACTLP